MRGNGGGKGGDRGELTRGGRGGGKCGPRLAPQPAGQALSLNPRELNELLGRTEHAQALLDLHRQFGHAFNHVNLATGWSKLGRMSPAERVWLQSDDGARLLALREQTRIQMLSLQARGVSTTAHAMAKLAIPKPAWGCLWTELEGAALACASDFMPQNLANTAWTFATVGHAAPALFDAIAVEAAQGVCVFHPRVWPTRRGPSPPLAMPPRRSSTRLR